jgi:hypothetical protein
LTNEEWSGVWQTGLVRCERDLEENPEANPGVEMYLQGDRDGEADEVVFFPGTENRRAAEDSCKIATESLDAMLVEGWWMRCVCYVVLGLRCGVIGWGFLNLLGVSSLILLTIYACKEG